MTRRAISAEAVDAGYRFIDIGDIAVAQNRKRGTMFAAFALFVDSVHLSPLGIRKLAEQISAPEETNAVDTTSRVR